LKYASYAAKIVFDAPAELLTEDVGVSMAKDAKERDVMKLTVPEGWKKYEYFFSKEKQDAAPGLFVYVRLAGSKNDETMPGMILEIEVPGETNGEGGENEGGEGGT
jgi:hypothetical protein